MNIITFIFGSPIKAQRQAARLSADASDSESLQEYYDTQLAPLAARYETKRVNSLKATRKRLYLSLAIVAGLVLLALLGHSRGLMLFPLPLVALLGLGFWSFTPTRQFKRQVQQEIYPIMFKYFGEDFIYNREMRLDMNRLTAAKVLPNYDKASFGDYIQGQYKGIELVVNELTLTKDVRVEEWDGNKRRTVTRTETRFRGTVVELSSHKQFIGHTVVLKDRGGLANFLSDSHSGLQRVKLEDPLFEKEFDVFSTDQIESRYLLNTAFMERLQQLAKSFDGEIQCAFFRNRLILFLPNRRSRFQMRSIFDSAHFSAEFSQLNREMKQLFAIIEVLKLNEHTGL
ncbi:DUF3137 domain-containing protein [Shewanella mangrovisoli]|uniref:DUF3137 domain-containing protein n=1 Tax=Shewanella mangrovisoli TaxID=2864211 RepID=UPI001C65B0BD|nr:DUF3137 domain-containing protein [Shewanella mangrovisoli]QYK09080.1 DUF3137 domain-containing protein [Shewanella mangrovisoli]